VDASTDAEFIRTSTEDSRAFEAVFDRHYQVIRRYAQRRAGLDLGEEIAASTFEVAFAERARFDADRFTSARPWLIGIANNLLKTSLRREATRHRVHPTSIVLEGSTPEPELGPLEASRRLPEMQSALSRLSESDRECFLLHVLGELSYEQVAEIQEVPVGTVRSRIHRARGILRELLTEVEPINVGDTKTEESDER
jgi:RNA polymerase sigma-70 factor (ECF subfamily)